MALWHNVTSLTRERIALGFAQSSAVLCQAHRMLQCRTRYEQHRLERTSLQTIRSNRRQRARPASFCLLLYVQICKWLE